MSVTKIFRLAGFATVACWMLSASPLLAQYHYGHYHGHYDLLSSRVYAQASLLRASGAASVDYAAARKIRAQAFRLELNNEVRKVEVYWERKEIARAKRLANSYNHLDAQKYRKNRTWERIKNHPDLIGGSITNGKALNFLLGRLSSSVLAYEFSKNSQSPGDQTIQALQLSQQTLKGLNLRQRLGNNRQIIFKATDGKPLQIDWWPYSLRDNRFKMYRKKFASLRDQAVKEAEAGTISKDTLASMEKTFFELSDEFRKYYNKDRRHKGGVTTWTEFKRADLFLKSLWGELNMLKSSEDISTLNAGLKFNPGQAGGNLVELLTFMSRNGLDFAPSKPKDAPAYHQTFAMMRDLYINIADEDEALKPTTDKYKSKITRKAHIPKAPK